MSTASRKRNSERLGLAVGDVVVYATHGVGRVVAREKNEVAGEARDCLIVELVNGLRVTLAVEDAADRLRAIAADTEIDKIGKVLGAEPPEREAAWPKRLQETKEKLGNGHAVGLAELVRDGALIELSAGSSRLSHSERQLYLQARELLAREIAWVRGLELEQAEAWIDAKVRTSKAFEA